jgi:hypothetical protein
VRYRPTIGPDGWPIGLDGVPIERQQGGAGQNPRAKLP